jgi:hypothetical protein
MAASRDPGMRVLVGCERSGIVRDAFRALGHDAMSCDIEPTDRPGPHYQGDVFDVIGDGWDIGIFHPPCTYLTRAGARWLFEDRPAQTAAERWDAMADALLFFHDLLTAAIPRVAVENPRMHAHAYAAGIPAPTQVIHPYEYGHPERKATALWLRGLPPLLAGEDTRAAMEALPRSVAQRIWALPPSADRARIRSETFPGIALAMAVQWGGAV